MFITSEMSLVKLKFPTYIAYQSLNSTDTDEMYVTSAMSTPCVNILVYHFSDKEKLIQSVYDNQKQNMQVSHFKYSLISKPQPPKDWTKYVEFITSSR